MCHALAQRVMSDPHPEVRAGALDALGAWGELAGPYGLAVVQRLQDPEEAVLQSAARYRMPPPLRAHRPLD